MRDMQTCNIGKCLCIADSKSALQKRAIRHRLTFQQASPLCASNKLVDSMRPGCIPGECESTLLQHHHLYHTHLCHTWRRFCCSCCSCLGGTAAKILASWPTWRSVTLMEKPS